MCHWWSKEGDGLLHEQQVWWGKRINSTMVCGESSPVQYLFCKLITFLVSWFVERLACSLHISGPTQACITLLGTVPSSSWRQFWHSSRYFFFKKTWNDKILFRPHNLKLKILLIISGNSQQRIEAASEALEQSVEVCNRYRKKTTVYESLGKIMKKTNYDASSEGKHAR